MKQFEDEVMALAQKYGCEHYALVIPSGAKANIMDFSGSQVLCANLQAGMQLLAEYIQSQEKQS